MFCDHGVSGIDIPMKWLLYIQEMTEKFDIAPWSPVCIPFSGDIQPQGVISDYIPDIIIWDPLSQFPTLVHTFQPCLAENCKLILNRKEWQKGQTSNAMPRIIHAINRIVLLVSRVYVCHSGHRFISHDERILERLPSPSHCPFVLSHRSGLTSECLTLVVSLINEGKKITSVRCALLETRKETFYQNILCSVELKRVTNQGDTSGDIPKFEKSISCVLQPGNKLLLSSFLQYFWRYELHFRQRMHNVNINDDWICCDHTFKSVTNIGIDQTRDTHSSKWIKQFKSLFLVLNDVGQILSWQLVPNTSYDTFCEMLKEVRERIVSMKKTLAEIYVDDCCKIRTKLQSIFGEATPVKLDLFHAIQRITKKTSKRHSLFNDFISSLKLVFRDPSDLSDIRQLRTPGPDILEKKLNAFVERWRSVKSHDGKIILTPPVLLEINKLRSHIAKGCLSYIKPGRGTNRDESLHRRINSFMKYSKIGTQLAYALLMSSFDTINEERKIPSERQSILQYVAEQTICSSKKTTATTPKFGLTTPTINSCAELSENETDDDSEEITDIHFTEILEKVKVQSQMVQEIKKQGINKAVFNERYLPFMNLASSLFFRKDSDINVDDFESHNNRLTSIVHGWGFEIITSEGDGNCFFYSAALALQNIVSQKDHSTTRTFLSENMGINHDMSISDVAQRLRTLMVTEWTTNPERYQPFLSTPLETEAQLFRLSGYFMGELGNTMPLALANILSSPVLLFTSMETMPVLIITPSIMRDAVPRVHLAFNQFGAGHYDAINIVSRDIEQTCENEISNTVREEADSSPIIRECSCGKNAKRSTTRKSVCTKSNTYSSRCPCYKNSRGCHDGCSCKGCENPYGKRELLPDKQFVLSPGPSRKRYKHSLSTKIDSGKDFMEKMDTKIERVWNPTEILIFEVLLQLLNHLQIPANADTIKKYFNRLAKRITQLGFEFEVVTKSLRDIQSRICSHDKALKAWLSGYYRKQQEENSQ